MNLNGKKSYDFDIQANQLSDILCRGATVSSIQSTNNTLTRNSTLRDTGDYDVPHPHPYTHHYMTTSTSATPQAMSIVGSRPGSASARLVQLQKKYSFKKGEKSFQNRYFISNIERHVFLIFFRIKIPLQLFIFSN